MDYPHTTRFESATVILPVMNETTSLDETVKIVLRDVKDKLKEILIVVCKRTTPEAMAVVRRLQAELGELVVVLDQTRPYLGGALRDAFDVARGSHVVMMASDLETDPHDVKHLIAAGREEPGGRRGHLAVAQRRTFHGYSPIKLLLNWIFQTVLFALLYWHGD